MNATQLRARLAELDRRLRLPGYRDKRKDLLRQQRRLRQHQLDAIEARQADYPRLGRPRISRPTPPATL